MKTIFLMLLHIIIIDFASAQIILYQSASTNSEIKDTLNSLVFGEESIIIFSEIDEKYYYELSYNNEIIGYICLNEIEINNLKQIFFFEKRKILKWELHLKTQVYEGNVENNLTWDIIETNANNKRKYLDNLKKKIKPNVNW